MRCTHRRGRPSCRPANACSAAVGARSALGLSRNANGTTSSPPTSPSSPGSGGRRATNRALSPVRTPYPTMHSAESGAAAASIAAHSRRSAALR